MKALRAVISVIVAAVGVWLCVVQDTMLDKLDFYIYSVCSSLLITLAVTFGIFTFIKSSLKRFIVVTAVVNALICLFHAYKLPYNTMNVGGFASHFEHFMWALPCNLLIAAGISALCILAYRLIESQLSKGDSTSKT